MDSGEEIAVLSDMVELSPLGVESAKPIAGDV
jgi:hypothetical protein